VWFHPGSRILYIAKQREDIEKNEEDVFDEGDKEWSEEDEWK
jgi:hypothetical protein